MGGKAPEDLIAWGTLIFLGRRTSALLWVMEEGCLFHSQGLDLRQVEREAEGRSDEGVLTEDFVSCGAQVRLF